MLQTSFNDMTVLIVEDDETLLESLKQMVRDFGVHSVFTAQDGEDGIAKLCEQPVDMVISDYRLTPINGLEFARRLRHGEGGADPTTPIIMLAADHERIQVEAVHDIGVNGFIDKPISPSSLYSSMLSVSTGLCNFIQTEGYIGPDRRDDPRGVIGVRESAGDKDSENSDQIAIDWSKVKSAMAAQPKLNQPAFIGSAHHDIEAMICALDVALRDPAQRRQAMRSIASLAGIVMEQGMAANYPLISSIAESLRNTCRRAPHLDRDQLAVVKSHITAMAALISDVIDGDSRAMDAAIINLLRGSDRQQNVHPQPVIWPRATA